MGIDNIKLQPRIFIGRGIESATIPDAIHALKVYHDLRGPAPPDDHIARRLIPESEDSALPPSRKAALAHMQSARRRALRTLFERGVIRKAS